MTQQQQEETWIGNLTSFIVNCFNLNEVSIRAENGLPMISKTSPIMAAIIDSRGDDVLPLLTATIGNYYGELSSAIAFLIDSYNKHNMSQRYMEFPEELWIQIFIRLSVKSLSQVMSVCKGWCNIIKDPDFTRQHLQFQKAASNSSGHFFLYHDNQTHDEFNYLLFNGESISNATKSSLLLPSYRNIFHFPLRDIYGPFKIDGPINGLYCMHNQCGRFVIWNPATNEVGFLPLPEQFIPYDVCYGKERVLYDSIVGFGVDPLDEKDYKVILICACLYTNDSSETSHCMLYTTRTNTWRLLNDGKRGVESMNNTFLKGSYYWMVKWSCGVIVFDMREEAFRIISTPCLGSLALHDDHITLFNTNEDLNEIEIWMLLEESKWEKIKKVCVGGIQGHVETTLGFWKTENDLLIVIDDSDCSLVSQTVLYNITTKVITNLGPRGYSDGFRAYAYYESLVSLSGDIIKCKGNSHACLFDTVCGFFVEDPIYHQDEDEDED